MTYWISFPVGYLPGTMNEYAMREIPQFTAGIGSGRAAFLRAFQCQCCGFIARAGQGCKWYSGAGTGRIRFIGADS